MSGIAHHLVKRGIDATRENYRSGSFAQDGDKKPFGHPHAVAAALILTSVLWFFALSAVSRTLPRLSGNPLTLLSGSIRLWRGCSYSDHDRNSYCNCLQSRPRRI